MREYEEIDQEDNKGTDNADNVSISGAFAGNAASLQCIYASGG
ncbi:hypothetical protein bsdcttw_39280 [Anaerocolumna chitinilytica]|uniref:Uncharacterized protein n=1 Tax=Anaerocolumna chitinilytica TaxID=1727145 RepID=A0A7I8DT47_9FIRM|nr:hypothetical protein bsdcttw_39280 [Anaerocolumna chitinilytica]